MNSFIAERSALQQEQEAFIASGATREQQDAWIEQNAPRVAAQRQQAEQIALQAALDPAPTTTAPAAPPSGASPTLAAAVAGRTALANDGAQLHNELVGTMPADATAQEVSGMQKEEMQLFAQRFGAQNTAQNQQTQAAGDQATLPTQLHLPPPPIPPDASAQAAACLAARDQLIHDEAQALDQSGAATPSARRAVLEQWREQNVKRLRQLQTQVQALPTND